MPASHATGPGLVWFRRDLRLEDNPAWAAATRRRDRVVALFVLDPRLTATAGPHRGRQLVAELRALDRSLRRLGGRLLVRRGDPVTVVPREAARQRAASVHWNADVTPYASRRDAAVAASLDAAVVPAWGTLVLPPRTIRTRDGSVPRVFSAFHRRWRAAEWDAWPEPGPTRIADDPGDGLPAPDGASPRPAGQDAALDLLDRFVKEDLAAYRSDRDAAADAAVPGLSVALHFGTVSPRRVVSVVGDTGPDAEAFVRQVAWRDWYAHLLHEQPALAERAIRPELARIRWRDDPDGLAAWGEGRTGYPVVDAGMRQLAATGELPNRIRMITASFLVKDLLIDWRHGERHFRRLLLDGDVAQNAGNWQWVAGTGPDAAPFVRVFNPVTQSRTHDPDGTYLRRWLPELARLDGAVIHAPWEAPPLDLVAAGVVLGETYPEPIVDHAVARARALDAYRRARAWWD